MNVSWILEIDYGALLDQILLYVLVAGVPVAHSFV